MRSLTFIPCMRSVHDAMEELDVQLAKSRETIAYLEERCDLVASGRAATYANCLCSRVRTVTADNMQLIPPAVYDEARFHLTSYGHDNGC